jgi:SAM-dependent methyltransferase
MSALRASSPFDSQFTPRRDLFLDAGFSASDRTLAALSDEIRRLALVSEWNAAGPALRQAFGPRLSRVPAAQLRLARLVPEWIVERNGDLVTALWLAHREHGESLDLAGFLLGIFAALLEAPGRLRDALAFAHFVFDLHYDWERLEQDSGNASEFLREREPNPLVWRVLSELGHRAARLRVLELGCGVGNDACGFLECERVEAYLGIDASQEALDLCERRVGQKRIARGPGLLRGDFLELLEQPTPQRHGVNLVYSYSSLHDFNSEDLTRLFGLVHGLLSHGGRGYFAFGMKGAGSAREGRGLPVYRPDVWIDRDGRSRWFPSREALQRQLDRAGFETFFHEQHDHWSYSERGKRDVFHHVLCAPR